MAALGLSDFRFGSINTPVFEFCSRDALLACFVSRMKEGSKLISLLARAHLFSLAHIHTCIPFCLYDMYQADI